MDTKQGTFVISLDTELLWGVIARPDAKRFEYSVRKVWSVLPKLLSLFHDYGFRATFAVVGHLMIDSCDELACPCHLLDRELVFGKELITMIRDAGHEIGIHGYTHKFFDTLSREEANREVSKAIQAAKNLGISVSSMVFPRNKVAFLDVLKQNDISCFRGADSWWFKRFPAFLCRLAHYIDQYAAIAPPVSSVIQESSHGLVNIPGSMFYMPMDGVRKYIPLHSRVQKAKKGIDRAILESKIFHLWSHPFNLSVQSDQMLRGLDLICSYAAKRREMGLLEVKTMQEVAYQ